MDCIECDNPLDGGGECWNLYCNTAYLKPKGKSKMKLLCLSTGEEVGPNDVLYAVSGDIQGLPITVRAIHEPSYEYPQGMIKHASQEGPHMLHDLHPRVLDCIFIQGDSVVMSITYDNEHSVGATIMQAVNKLKEDNRVVRKILVGFREWDKIRDLASQAIQQTAIIGKPPPPTFYGVLIERMQHRERCLAFEHGPTEGKNNGEA